MSEICDSSCQSETAARASRAAIGAPPPVMIAHPPSPVDRVLHDLEAELGQRALRHETVATLCDRLLNNLIGHFEKDELAAVLPEPALVAPAAKEEAEQCIEQRRQTLLQATQLARRSREETRDLRWQRQLNREFVLLRSSLNAQHRREVELVRNAYRLDIKESD